MTEVIYTNKSSENLLEKHHEVKIHIAVDEDDSTENQSLLKRVLIAILRILGLITCLYFFVVSLNLMSTSFPLIAGKYASEAFRSNVVLTNPLAGLMIGILATVVVQSSSTSTSIIVSMVASEIIPVRFAIPIIMGSNIGTSVTSTLVALSQAMDKEKFRLSFSGATVHDMFNLLTVGVLLPVELAFRLLERVSLILVAPIHTNAPGAEEPELLNAITKPLTEAIIRIDKHILDKIATNQSSDDVSLIKRTCGSISHSLNETFISNAGQHKDESCYFLFKNVDWPDWVIGTVLLVISLLTLSTCLVGMVKILTSIFNGPVAMFIQKMVNSDLPGIFKYFTGFLAILVGSILTMLVQSSSVFTSTLTPLVGMGLVSLERVYPLTLGANMGTTVTGILASISGPTKTLHFSLQIALCHTLFNLLGILLWYPVPFMRRMPIRMARFLGDTTAEYRWFAIAYVIVLFFLMPILVFSLSMLGTTFFITFMAILLSLVVIVVAINFMQSRCADRLPAVLRDWSFLPRAFRSLDPYDEFITTYLCCLKCCKKLVVPSSTTTTNAEDDKQPPHISNHITDYSNKEEVFVHVHNNKAYITE